jgi:hypothetical protein
VYQKKRNSAEGVGMDAIEVKSVDELVDRVVLKLERHKLALATVLRVFFHDEIGQPAQVQEMNGLLAGMIPQERIEILFNIVKAVSFYCDKVKKAGIWTAEDGRSINRLFGFRPGNVFRPLSLTVRQDGKEMQAWLGLPDFSIQESGLFFTVIGQPVSVRNLYNYLSQSFSLNSAPGFFWMKTGKTPVMEEGCWVRVASEGDGNELGYRLVQSGVKRRPTEQ